MIEAPVVGRHTLGGATLLTLALPGGIDPGGAAGRFVLARCTPGNATTRAWDPFLRQPLFAVRIDPRGEVALWSFLLPPLPRPGAVPLPEPLRAEPAAAVYLHGLRPGDTLNLLGPLGNGFKLDPRTRTLLLAADAPRPPLLLPLIDGLLDRGGRVALLLDGGEAGQSDENDALLPLLPLPVEARVEANAGFAAALAAMAPWADQVCLALPMADYAQAAAALRSGRPRLNEGDALALVEAPFPCGVGACLACVVTLASGGHTRACVHGPVMDLNRLA